MKVYYKSKDLELNDEAYISYRLNKVYPVETLERVEKQVIRPTNKLKAIFLFIGACFILSEVNVTKAPIPDAVAYIISFILLVASYYHFFTAKIDVVVFLKNGRTLTCGWTTNSGASKFVLAVKEMLRDYEYKNKKQADN
jgi:hypothetical protein